MKLPPDEYSHDPSIQKRHISKQKWHSDEFRLRNPVIRKKNILAMMCYLYRRTRLSSCTKGHLTYRLDGQPSRTSIYMLVGQSLPSHGGTSATVELGPASNGVSYYSVFPSIPLPETQTPSVTISKGVDKQRPDYAIRCPRVFYLMVSAR